MSAALRFLVKLMICIIAIVLYIKSLTLRFFVRFVMSIVVVVICVKEIRVYINNLKKPDINKMKNIIAIISCVLALIGVFTFFVIPMACDIPEICNKNYKVTEGTIIYQSHPTGSPTLSRLNNGVSFRGLVRGSNVGDYVRVYYLPHSKFVVYSTILEKAR